MGTVLLVLHLMVAIFLVGVILIQRSSGGALDGLGGGSGASSFLNVRGTGNFLTRATAILATLFICTSISLSLYYRGFETKSNSIMDAPVAPVEAPLDLPTEPTVPVAGE